MNRPASIVALAVIGLLAHGSLASKILDLPPGGGGRVADFYETVSETDRNACQQILISLNKEHVTDTGTIPPDESVSLAGETFLWSDLQIPWVRKFVQETEPPDPREVSVGPGALNVAQVKLSGRSFTVLKRDMEKYDEGWNATLSINRLWIAAGQPPSFPSDRKLTQTDLAQLGGTEVLLGLPDRRPRDGKQLKFATASKSSGPMQSLLLNALTVNGNLYLLALDAGEAEVHALRGGDGTVDVYALKYHSETDVRLACLFRGL